MNSFATRHRSLFHGQSTTFRPNFRFYFRFLGRFRKVTAMSILRFLQNWRRYNASLRELSHLDDRELADIGISRSDIPRVALAAANS